MNLSLEIRNRIHLNAVRNGYDNNEDYIKYLIDKDEYLMHLPNILSQIKENLENLNIGQVFTIFDLVKLDSLFINYQVIEESQLILESYMFSSNMLNEYELLYCDIGDFINYYIRKV